MPTVRRIGGFRFFFYSNEGAEHPHILVEGAGVAEFWLEPVALASSGRLRALEVRRLERLVNVHQQEFLEAWRDSFLP